MKKKIEIGEQARVRIKWQTLPTDYSFERANDIQYAFAKKYGIPKDNIKVVGEIVRKTSDGELVPYENEITANIQDPLFQQQLFKMYLDEHEITDCDFDKIIAIDTEINSRIDYDLYEQNKHYTIKWMRWSNFMSYGKDNFVDFTTLNGLILLTSEPANQGGKTTFCIDLLRFLLFGKVTNRENDWTLSKVFNKHLKEATECVVEGCVCIDGVDYVIKRVVTRPAAAKRTAKSKVTQKISYYRLVNNEYVELEDEDCLDENTSRDTNKAIKEAIGNERDFDLMICVDADNLKSLISLKDTDRGRLISRWIGLLPLEEKDKIAREMYNKTIVSSLISTRYNKNELSEENEALKKSNEELDKMIADTDKKIAKSDKDIEKHLKTRDALLSSKRSVDDSLMKVDVKTLEMTLAKTTEDGKRKREELKVNKEELAKIGEISFSEKEYSELQEAHKAIIAELSEARYAFKVKTEELKTLKNSEYCPTCGARLKGVDNSQKIAEKEKEIEDVKKAGTELNKKETDVKKKIEDMEEARSKYNTKARLSLIIDKNEVDIENFIAKYKETQRILNDIEANKSAIENNNKIETSLNIVNENIKQEQNYNNTLRDNKKDYQAEQKANSKTISDNEKLIATIQEEEKTLRDWKLYLEMIGKNGICKMVLRTVLPVINNELRNLLDDVCDFTVEVSIDDHNDVAFSMIHDGVVSNLGSGSGFEKTVSSLALRSVLSKISSFSKPSFVVFDEILGGVAEENYDQVKELYDKIVKDYQMILQITHLKPIADWHNKTITVVKTNNVSKIKDV